MNFRLTWILFGVLILAVAGLLISTMNDDKPPPDAVLLDTLTGVKETDVDRIEIVRTEPAEQKLLFVRAGKDKWELKEPVTAKIDSAQVNAIATSLLKLKPTTYSEITSNLTIHGLDKPTISVTFHSGEKKTGTLNIGDTTIGKERAVTFVTTGTRPKVPVAVRRSDLETLFRAGTSDGKAWQIAKGLTDFRQKRLIASDIRDATAELQSIKIKKGDKETVLTQTSAGEWRFTAPEGYGLADTAGDPEPRPETFTGVRPLLNALTAMQVTEGTDFIESPEPLEKYGLKPDDKETIRIELTPKEGPPEVLFIGKKVDDKPGKHYCLVAGDPCVMKVTTDRTEALARIANDPFDLRDRTLVSELKKDAIDAIEITVGTSTVKARKVPVGPIKKWVLYGGPSDPQIAGPAIDDLIATLTKPRAARDILTAPNDAAFADAEKKAEIRLWIDGTEKPVAPPEADKLPADPKLKGDGKPTLTLLFGKKEGDVVFVRRVNVDGAKSDLKLTDTVLTLATRDRLAYLDPKLKSFVAGTAKQLTFNRGGELFELNLDATKSTWSFDKPERLKGQSADADKLRSLIGVVATLTPDRIVAENPPEPDLVRFGLGASPRMKVTVGLNNDKDKERTYEFGNETDDKTRVYIRQSGRTAVMTVPVDNFNRFAVDLRDPTIYTLDVAKVKGIKLRGWKQLFGGPVEYAFEKKGSDWTTSKSPAAFAVDPVKLNALLGVLTSPHAAAFVGGAAKPEQGFDLNTAANSLEITIDIEGGTPIVLTLGNDTDGGANYFATCSARKDEVLTVSTVDFRTYREKPGSLQK